ncbi:MAG: prepilin-type N-terminal cleavage/methylation domain-containing protein [Chitinispirillaceae bacterium]|nr:prepilin-type N-terminal cleavage/methylation domain-containing protein [Chitinispirillaceae bacterium]
MLRKKKDKGFTLVEVIVVAVIVAVLAAVAIPLYIGYIRDSNISACNNAAGSAASFLAAARNAEAASGFPAAQAWNAGAQWSTNLPSGQVVTYVVPEGMIITTTGTQAAGGTVTCRRGTYNSNGNFNY